MSNEQDLLEKWQRLALLFPTVRDAFGSHYFKPKDLDRWASSSAREGGLHAAKFLLSQWNSLVLWECGRFCVVDAMAIWNAEHRAAFLAWAHEPWWP
jgi:hypothetical protein